MPKFTDNKGQEWPVEVTVGTVKRVRKLLDVDLLEILGGKLIEKLRIDPVFLVDLLYVVVKPEADALKVTDEDFGYRMAGQAIEDGTSALLEAIVSFFPSPGDRANLKQILDKTSGALDTARSLTLEKIKRTDVEGMVRAAMQSGPGSSSASVPASSG